MLTRFSKPAALVTVRPGTSPLRPVTLVMLDLSSVAPDTAVMATGVFCRLVFCLSAETVTCSAPPAEPSDVLAGGAAVGLLFGLGVAV